jgi:hypothetical protein
MTIKKNCDVHRFKTQFLRIESSFTVLNPGSLKIKIIFRAGNSFEFLSSRPKKSRRFLGPRKTLFFAETYEQTTPFRVGYKKVFLIIAS